MATYAEDMIKKFGYWDVFTNAGVKDSGEIELQPSFIKDFNHRNHELSIKNLYEEEEITSIYINYPALLLRRKSEVYPNGRTSHRFKNALRRRVTIVDKNLNFVD